MNDDDRLERESRAVRRVRDLTHVWDGLSPLSAAPVTVLDRVERLCAAKRITRAALDAQGVRYAVRGKGRDEYLAWGYSARVNGHRAVTAIKYRHLTTGEKTAEDGSVYLEPMIVGDRLSLDWIVSEGETDGARVFDFVGNAVAIMVIPAGASTFKPEWAAMIPRGATVHLAHDADEKGDEGAAKAADLIGGRTVRVRPPDGVKDWCEWDGNHDQFVALVAAARASRRQYEFVPLDDFLEHRFPNAEPLLGEPGQIFLAVGSLMLTYGAEGTGKSTHAVDGIAHLAAGRDWLEIPVPRPVRFCVIENEGPPGLFQQKLADKAASWDDPADWTTNIFLYQTPWGEFSFADPDARQALTAFCDEHQIDVVVANPTLGLGVAGSGRPDETQQFIDWLVECGLKTTRAFWLLHHENKAGQISGDWGRHPDTKLQLQADGNQPRTKLIWEKTRWATLPTDTQPKACLLEWVIETKSYTIIPLEARGATDDELHERIDTFLTDHPRSSANVVEKNVKGTGSRIREALKSGKYATEKGLRGANLYSLRDNPVALFDDEPTR